MTGGGEQAASMLQWFLNYGLVAAIAVWAGTVALMAYHLTDSPWRWAFVALAFGGLVTIAGIFRIRKYVDGMKKSQDQQVRLEGHREG